MADFSEIIRWFKDLASLIDTKPVFRWGVVTNADPLLVQLDADDRPIAGSPSTIIGGLVAGERVLCMVQNRRVTIIGSSKGQAYQPGDTFGFDLGTRQAPFHAMITNGRRNIYLQVPLPKPVSSNATAIVTQVWANVRKAAGGYWTYGAYQAGGHNLLGDSRVYVDDAVAVGSMLLVVLVCSSDWDATNNAALSFDMCRFEVNFT